MPSSDKRPAPSSGPARRRWRTPNAERNDVAELIDVSYSDVFSTVERTFNLIVFDPPFRWFRPRDDVETATTDENFRAMTTFFRQARSHLDMNGRMLIFFGTSGDAGYLRKLMALEGFEATTLATDRLLRDGWDVGVLHAPPHVTGTPISPAATRMAARPSRVL